MEGLHDVLHLEGARKGGRLIGEGVDEPELVALPSLCAPTLLTRLACVSSVHADTEGLARIVSHSVSGPKVEARNAKRGQPSLKKVHLKTKRAQTKLVRLMSTQTSSSRMVVMMGPWSGGKSTMINYILGNEFSKNAFRSSKQHIEITIILISNKIHQFIDV